MKVSKQAQEEARKRLRELLPPGSTVYTVLRHVSSSGMTRAIDTYHFAPNPGSSGASMRKIWLSRLVAKATGFSFSELHEALSVGGCGVDMGYHIVENLGYALYPDGFECVGKDRCPSNDHSNGDRNYTPHHHSSGGYVFHHEWI